MRNVPPGTQTMSGCGGSVRWRGGRRAGSRGGLGQGTAIVRQPLDRVVRLDMVGAAPAGHAAPVAARSVAGAEQERQPAVERADPRGLGARGDGGRARRVVGQRRGIRGEREGDLLATTEAVRAGRLLDEPAAAGSLASSRASASTWVVSAALSATICSARAVAAEASPTWRAKRMTIQTATSAPISIADRRRVRPAIGERREVGRRATGAALGSAARSAVAASRPSSSSSSGGGRAVGGASGRG